MSNEKSPEKLAEAWLETEIAKATDKDGNMIGGWDDPLYPDSCDPKSAFLAGLTVGQSLGRQAAMYEFGITHKKIQE